MIGLAKKKEQEQAAAAAAANAIPASGPTPGRGRAVSIIGIKKEGGSTGANTARRLKPGEIRVQKDVSELDGGDCVETDFPNPNDLMRFNVTVYVYIYVYRRKLHCPTVIGHVFTLVL
jgi:hypothetical protein